MKSIHPFPARMAPELALERMSDLPAGATVLDPMAGSGTVLRQAAAIGHRSLGFDMDPLAVLMSRVATTACDVGSLENLATRLVDEANGLDGRRVKLDWIDGDFETSEFVRYWFAPKQRLALRKLAKIFESDQSLRRRPRERDALLLALSRIIVTKEQRASLARDTSRSRPHKVAESNDFNVFEEYLRSVERLQRILMQEKPVGDVQVCVGDARQMDSLADGSVDAVITSPPYLNAIDYLRGHRMSLVWMGYSIPDLRSIRSTSVGAERGPDEGAAAHIIEAILGKIGLIGTLPKRYQGMIKRYVHDLYVLLKEIFRVTCPGGQATFVIGNSCLKEVFIQNSNAVIAAAELNGFKLIRQSERALPDASRSLPMLNEGKNALSKRMRTECVLIFERMPIM